MMLAGQEVELITRFVGQVKVLILSVSWRVNKAFAEEDLLMFVFIVFKQGHTPFNGLNFTFPAAK